MRFGFLGEYLILLFTLKLFRNEILTGLKINGDVSDGVLLQDALLVLLPASRDTDTSVFSSCGACI